MSIGQVGSEKLLPRLARKLPVPVLNIIAIVLTVILLLVFVPIYSFIVVADKLPHRKFGKKD